ncbi:3'-5' exonuclease family protein [Geomonas anaerohicana]|uniref:3'-5' exoribonuclease n=1 Tax=Geomonas anaerohicana TaxID=2798583 RepID=A0ABS0YFY6_9BACT|nr:3'-5' exoribonuclease [Geomonas anaerohicana]MBJ6751177.1 3'-5' exoribonuclease [Geomonas anaerohicana]
MKTPKTLVILRERYFAFALKVVDLIVRFKRTTEKMFLSWEKWVKPEGDIALEKLVSRFPRYLTPPSGSVRCGPGWYPLVWDLCTAIEAMEHLAMPKIGHFKAEERLGGLFVRVGSRSSIVKELAKDVEHKATAICSECGAQGSLQLGHGFAKTLCPAHAKKRKPQKAKQVPISPELAAGEPMLLFLDTEFTDFDYPQLISIALVSESGESFYAELANGWSHEGCSPFVTANVLPQLTGGEFFQERSYARRRLADWVASFGVPVRVVCDAPGFDWVLMVDLLHDAFPKNLYPAPIHYYSESFPGLFELLQKAHAEAYNEFPPHHALHDAEALREAWEVMKEHLHPAILKQYLKL